MTALLNDLLKRCAFPEEDHLVCAVSGGADSLALLALAAATKRQVTAVHVDHGLREGSRAEADVVAKAAQRFGATFQAEQVTVEPGPNLEARARSARYSVLPEGVLTGHTADDQAETVLMNLMRGAGMSGLAGMRPEGHPILRLRRFETHALCEDLELTPVQDPSNFSDDFLRNRVRNELLPLMNELSERDVAAVIAGQTDGLWLASDLLDSLASRIDPTDALRLAAAHPELASRSVRAWLRAEIDDELHPPDRKAVARVMAVARGEAKSCDVLNGVRVRRSQQRLILEHSHAKGT